MWSAEVTLAVGAADMAAAATAQCVGRRGGGGSASARRQTCLVASTKKGAHVPLPPKFFTFSDAEINADYDFTIKHNLI